MVVSSRGKGLSKTINRNCLFRDPLIMSSRGKELSKTIIRNCLFRDRINCEQQRQRTNAHTRTHTHTHNLLHAISYDTLNIFRELKVSEVNGFGTT